MLPRAERSSSRLTLRRVHKGMALLLVMIAIATAALLAYALLATATVQAQIGGNDARVAQGKLTAESGLDLAAYYLEHPDRSPVTLTRGAAGDYHYGGETNLSLANLPGRLTISVTNPAAGLYDVTSTATVDGYTRSATATYETVKEFPVNYGLYTRGTLLLPLRLTVHSGGMVNTGLLSLTLPAQVNGPIMAQNLVGLLGITIAVGDEKAAGVVVENDIDVYNASNSANNTYIYEGKTCYAKKLGADVTGTTTVLLDPDTTTNPANVWYCDTARRLSGNVTLDGTLILKSAKTLDINGNVTITPKTGMPGLLAGGDIRFVSNSRTLTVNGVVYVNGEITSPLLAVSTLNDKVIVRGAMFFGKQDLLVKPLNYGGTIDIHYTPENVHLSHFSAAREFVKGLRVRSWNENP